MARKKQVEITPEADGLMIGYARVSTKDQSLEAQITDLIREGCHPDHIHKDVKSGASRKRPGLAMLWKDIREGDTVIVTSVDRFGRSTIDLLNNLERLTEMGVRFRSVKERLDTSTPMGKFTFTLLASLAELERNWIADRTSKTMQHNKAEKGAKYGREFSLSEEKRAELRALKAAGKGVTWLAKRYKISRATVRNYAKEKPPEGGLQVAVPAVGPTSLEVHRKSDSRGKRKR
jgi:DNA invertase Pin-like site-specific DNA recombinase